MMAYANGRIPLSALRAIHPYGYLLSDAAVAYEAMRSAALADGVILKPAGPDASTYRNLPGQVKMRAYWCGRGQCGKAAVPGTSNHGLGKAVDFWLDSAGKVYRWLAANAHRFGFSHAEGARVGELWHWVYMGGYTPKRDPLWYMTARERRLTRELVSLQALKHPTATQVARRREVWRWLDTQRGVIYHAAKAHGGWHSASSKANHRLSRYRKLYKITH